MDQNSSSHVSCGVIGFDRRRISKTVRDWLQEQGKKVRAGANYWNRKWEAALYCSGVATKRVSPRRSGGEGRGRLHVKDILGQS